MTGVANAGIAQDIVLVEDDPTGHRLTPLRLVAEALLQDGQRVHLATSDEFLAEESAAAWVRSMGDGLTVHVGSFGDITALARLSETLNATQVVILDGDDVLNRIALKGGWRTGARLTVLAIRPTGQSTVRVRAAMESLAKQCLRLVARWRGVNVKYVVGIAHGDSYRHGVVDPVELSADESALSAFPELAESDGTVWFAILGGINSRKNVPLVLTALSHLGHSNRVGLILVGKVAPDVRRFLDSHPCSSGNGPVRVVVHDRRVDDAELDAVVREVDCVVLAHSNDMVSNVMSKALLAGTWVVAAGAPTLRRDLAASPGHGEWVPLREYDLSDAFRRVPEVRPIPLPPLAAGEFARQLLA